MVLEEDIRQFVSENFIVGEVPLGSDDSLTQTGIMDSLGVLELIVFLEQRYGVHVSEGETLPENLDSINNVVRFLERKLSRSLDSREQPAVSA